MARALLQTTTTTTTITTTVVAMVLLQAGITTPTTRAVERASLWYKTTTKRNKGKGKGGPNPTPKGKSKGKGKTAFLDGVAFEDAYILMIEAFSNGKGKHSTQIHTDNASMDMDNNVYLGDVATTMVREMKNRSAGPSAAIVQST